MPSDDLAATEIQPKPKLEFGDDYSGQFIVFILGALGGGTLVAVAALIFFHFLTPPQPTQSQLQSEYYRGIYDICTAQVSPTDPNFVDVCNKAIAEKFKAGDWYSQTSEGYIP